jgi:hypothetical protein
LKIVTQIKVHMADVLTTHTYMVSRFSYVPCDTKYTTLTILVASTELVSSNVGLKCFRNGIPASLEVHIRQVCSEQFRAWFIILCVAPANCL